MLSLLQGILLGFLLLASYSSAIQGADERFGAIRDLQSGGEIEGAAETPVPSVNPTTSPSSSHPSPAPSTTKPSVAPSTPRPSKNPSQTPTTSKPSSTPVTSHPSGVPTVRTTAGPTQSPVIRSKAPSTSPSGAHPSRSPLTSHPSFAPSMAPTTTSPSKAPTRTTNKPSKAPSASPTPYKRTYPSLLIMMADDLGYGDVGYLGGWAKTPNIDKLANAKSSLRLDNFHSASAVCSPSRVSMFSGRNPERDCIAGPLENTNGKTFRDNMQSLASYSKRAGFKTAFYGKWHLGAKTPQQIGFDDFIFTPMNTPTYDPACFCPEKRCLDSCNAKNAFCYRVSPRRCGSRLSLGCQTGSYRTAADFTPMNWFCNLQAGGLSRPRATVNFPRGVSSAEYMAELANTFLRNVPKVNPFLLYVFFNEPHEPFIASDTERARCFAGDTCTEDVRPYGPASPVSNYYAAIHVMDRAIGTILDTLQQTNRALDTIVIFTSDNGPEVYAYGGIQNVPTRTLRGSKRLVYEGGLRVPSIMSWPQHVTANQIVTQATTMLDIVPTFASILAAITPSLGLLMGDGQSIAPLFTQPEWVRTKPFLSCMPITELQGQVCVTYAYFEGPFKVVITNNDVNRPEIFNIITDAQETRNLLGSLPSAAALVNSAVMMKNSILGEFNNGCAKPTRRRRRRGRRG